MGPAQKKGQEMTAQEQERVFGLEPRAPPSAEVTVKPLPAGLAQRMVVPSSAAASTGVTASGALRTAARQGLIQRIFGVSFREAITDAAAADGDGEQLDGEGDAEGDIAAAAEPAVEPEVGVGVVDIGLELTPDPPTGTVDDGPTDMEI